MVRSMVRVFLCRTAPCPRNIHAEAQRKTAATLCLTRHVVGDERSGAPIPIEPESPNRVTALQSYGVQDAVAPRRTSDFFLRPGSISTANGDLAAFRGRRSIGNSASEKNARIRSKRSHIVQDKTCRADRDLENLCPTDHESHVSHVICGDTGSCNRSSVAIDHGERNVTNHLCLTDADAQMQMVERNRSSVAADHKWQHVCVRITCGQSKYTYVCGSMCRDGSSCGFDDG